MFIKYKQLVVPCTVKPYTFSDPIIDSHSILCMTAYTGRTSHSHSHSCIQRGCAQSNSCIQRGRHTVTVTLAYREDVHRATLAYREDVHRVTLAYTEEVTQDT